MVSETRQEKSPQKLRAEGMSKVQQLVRRLQSGALKSELRTTSEAVHGARALYQQIELAGIPPKDFHVHIAYLTPDLSTMSTQPFEPGQETKIQAALSGMCAIHIGLVFAIRDLERGHWLAGARPFLNTPLVRKAFDTWEQEMLSINAEN